MVTRAGYKKKTKSTTKRTTKPRRSSSSSSSSSVKTKKKKSTPTATIRGIGGGGSTAAAAAVAADTTAVFAKKTRTAARRTTAKKRQPNPAALLKKVATVSDSTKTLSKEIKLMTKIFAENQKVLLSMKNMIDNIIGGMELIQKQSRQINVLEEDAQKLYAGLNQVRGQSSLVTRINDQTARLQDQIRKITEAQKSSPKTEKLAQTVSDSVNSIRNNSQMIIKMAQRVDEVRDDLRRVSAKTGAAGSTPAAALSVGSELEGIKKKIESISGKAEKIESLGGVIEGLRQQFQSVLAKSESLSNLGGRLQNMQNEISSLAKRTDSSFVGDGLKSVQSEFSNFKENISGKTSTIEQKLSSLSDLLKRSDALTSEFHKKTDKVFQELQGIRDFTSKTSSDTSKDVIALLKLSEYQSNIRMRAESKYGDLKDIEKMAYQTAAMVNLFDNLSIESQQKMALPHEVRQWAVSKILDCADKWDIRFSDVFRVLLDNIGHDMLKEAIRIQQVRDIFGIRGVDEVRRELNIIPQTSSEAS